MLVSIIVPTYNGERFIRRTIKSILNQTYSNWELIVVDDASTDGTVKAVEKFVSSDSRIRLIKLNKNSGSPAHPRNIGLENASGEIICLLDQDDEWLPQKIEMQVQMFKSAGRDVGVIYCGYYGVYKGRIIYEKRPKLKGHIYYSALKNCPIGALTSSIRAECFEKVGVFDEVLYNCDDWDIWIRISKHYKFDFVNKSLAFYHIHKGQSSTSLMRTIRDREIILCKYFKELLKKRRILSWHLRRLGSLWCLNKEYAKGRAYLLKSISVYPFNIGSYIHLFLSCVSISVHQKAIKRFGIRKINNIYLIN